MISYNSRSDDLVVEAGAGGPSTCMYFVSNPLPEGVKQIRATIRCHNQGWCSDPAGGSWTWWEASVLRPCSETKLQDLSHLSTTVRQGINSFVDDIVRSGWSLQNLGDSVAPILSRRILTVPLSQRPVSCSFLWAQGDHDQVASSGNDTYSILETLQEGDRLVFWALAQFRGWKNYIKGVTIELATADQPFGSTEKILDASEDSSASPKGQTSGDIHSRIPDRSQLLLEPFRDGIFPASHADEHTNHELVTKEAESAVLLTLSDSSDQAHRSLMLSILNSRTFRRTGQLSDLNLAITMAEEAFQLTPPTEHSGRVQRLHYLGNLLLCRYQCTEKMTDLELAIERADELVRIMSPEHPGYIVWLSDFANMLLCRYRLTNQILDLETAIETAEKAEKLEKTSRTIPTDHKFRAVRLNNYALLLQNRYFRTCQLGDLELAINKTQEAVHTAESMAPTSNFKRLDSQWLMNLGNLIGDRYKHTGHEVDLKSWINVMKEVSSQENLDHTLRENGLTSLATLFGERYKLTGQMTDLDIGIQCVNDTLLTPSNPINRAVQLNVLGRLLGHRYEGRGDIVDLDSAIKFLEQAVQMTPTDYPQRGDWLDNLAVMHLSRYERTAKIMDLDLAIETEREAMLVTPDGHVNRAVRLNNLGLMLLRQYQRTSQIADLDSAIENAKEAVVSTPVNDTFRTKIHANLGTMLSHRYQHTGQMADLDAGIDETEAAVLKAPADHPLRAGSLSNLSNLLVDRYERAGRLADLEMAIEKTQDAVLLTPSADPQRAGRLSNLGRLFVRRFERTWKSEDLDLAVEKVREAVDSTPSDHSERAGWLSNLGSMLLRRYEADKRMDDLDSAIDQAQEAVRTTPADHAKQAGYLNNLGNMLRHRYLLHHRPSDIETAIEKAEEAERLTPDEHPSRVGVLYTLALNQLASRDLAQIGNGLVSFVRSWKCSSGVPSQRLKSAVAAVDFLIALRAWALAADLAVDAIGLIPIMNKRSLSRDDQQHMLSMYSGLAATTCSLMLQSDRPVEKSVEVLELGRGAIIGLLIDDRRDISDLQKACPEEAELYDRLRSGIQVDNYDQTSDLTQEQKSKHIFKTVKELDECIARIRQIPGLERFQLGSSAQELQQQARSGPIIIVNVTALRSDSIVVESHQVRAISLPKFSSEQLRSWKEEKLTRYTKGSEKKKKNSRYLEFLKWIWEHCVGVIFERLDEDPSMSPISQPNCRVWWMGVGDASGVPFHAAGDHSPGSKTNTFSRVISSYTPTIKALEFAREKQALERESATKANGTIQRRLCITTMPETPGSRSLEVATEVDGIDSVAKWTFEITKLSGGNSARVKEELQSCHLFHFAGHGLVKPVDPSRSCLVLRKRNEDDSAWVRDELSVEDISRMNLPHAYLAYLPACSTADHGGTKLADEVLHMVSGFQIAGFAHAVGSMWQSENATCVKVAQAFYRRLSQKQRVTDEDGVVAEALQFAVDEIRTRNEVSRALPLSWAQFVHFGA